MGVPPREQKDLVTNMSSTMANSCLLWKSKGFLAVCYKPGGMPFISLYVSVYTRLTCAVWSGARPCSIGQTLACDGAGEQVSLHARIHDGVGESRAAEARDAAVSRCSWVTTLHR